MLRIVVTSFVVALAVVLVAGSAWAGPEATLLVPKTERPTSLFGYAGRRPLDPSSPKGIIRPTPAPRIETAAFGAATRCLPARPAIVRPTPAPDLRVASRDERRIVIRECSGGACAPCGTGCPTSRIDDDPLSVATVYWSSGYHDGQQVRRCDPCEPCVSQPVYRSPCEPCDPCPTVSRCATPCYTPRYQPCYVPYRRWCGPRVRIAPYWGGCGWGGRGWGPRWGWGAGWGWGGCW